MGRYKEHGVWWTSPGVRAASQRTSLQQADYEYNLAVSNEIYWGDKKDEAFKKYKAELEKADATCTCCPKHGTK
jgi:hypothetical protein